MARSLKYQIVEARPKTVESFEAKLDREGKSYRDPLNEITDLAGVRIIVYYAKDISLASQLVDDEFVVDSTRSIDKSMSLAPDQFGYLSVHKIIRLSASRAALLEWQPLENLTAEIQIRSVLQHSWAAISHALQYKHESDVPPQFRRRLVRVSGLLELADQEFGALREEQAAFSTVVAESVAHGNFDLSVNAVTIREFVAHSEIIRTLSRAAESANFKVFVQTPEDEQEPTTQLVRAAYLLDISTIAEFESLLQEALPKAQEFFKAFRDTRDKSHMTAGTAEHWAAVLIVALRGHELTSAQIKDIGSWGPDYINCIKKSAATVFRETAASRSGQ